MKRCTVDAFGRTDEYVEPDIEFSVSGASGVLSLTFLDDTGAWKASVAYPPKGWKSMHLRFMDETERDEVESRERTLDTDSEQDTMSTNSTISSTEKVRNHGE